MDGANIRSFEANVMPGKLVGHDIKLGGKNGKTMIPVEYCYVLDDWYLQVDDGDIRELHSGAWEALLACETPEEVLHKFPACTLRGENVELCIVVQSRYRYVLEVK